MKGEQSEPMRAAAEDVPTPMFLQSNVINIITYYYFYIPIPKAFFSIKFSTGRKAFSKSRWVQVCLKIHWRILRVS